MPPPVCPCLLSRSLNVFSATNVPGERKHPFHLKASLPPSAESQMVSAGGFVIHQREQLCPSESARWASCSSGRGLQAPGLSSGVVSEVPD